MLCGSLELANRSIISGSVRLVYAILYALFLGFGLAMGSELYTRATGLTIQGGQNFTCSDLRINAPWYMATISPWFCEFGDLEKISAFADFSLSLLVDSIIPSHAGHEKRTTFL